MGLLKEDAPHPPPALGQTHQNILSRVYFSAGARRDAVVALLEQAGFRTALVDSNLKRIHKAQARNFSFFKGLARGLQHRYAISVVKP
jgi:hypothetical protein